MVRPGVLETAGSALEGAYPAYVRDNPVMAAAFAAFMRWIWDQPDARKLFEEEEGMVPLATSRQSPINALIDQATGHSKNYAERFFDWAVRTQWGAEGDPALETPPPADGAGNGTASTTDASQAPGMNND